MDKVERNRQKQRALEVIADGLEQVVTGIRQLAKVPAENPPSTSPAIVPPTEPCEPIGMPASERRLLMMLLGNVSRLTGLSRASIYQKMNEGRRFSAFIQTRAKLAAWRRGEIEDWLGSKKRK